METHNIKGNKVLLGAFADEAATSHGRCDLGEIFSVMNALGINYWTPRWGFNPAEGRNVNIADTQDHAWIKEVRKLSDDHGLQVQVLGSTLMKCSLFEGNAGKQKYVPEGQVLEQAKHTIENAHILGAPFIRGFAGYQTSEMDYLEAFGKVSRILRKIGELCAQAGINYVIEPEPEATYMGNNARRLFELAKETRLDNIVLLHNGSNFHVQSLDAVEEAKTLLRSGRLAGVHVKAYGKPVTRGDVIDDEYHVPVDEDKTGYKEVFERIVIGLPELNDHIHSLGGQGFFVTLAPRLAISKDRPSYEGPRTMGIARNALVKMLDECRISYR